MNSAAQELQTLRQQRNRSLKLIGALGLIAILEGYFHHKIKEWTLPNTIPAVFLSYNMFGYYICQREINKINRIKIESNTIVLPPNHYSIR